MNRNYVLSRYVIARGTPDGNVKQYFLKRFRNLDNNALYRY